MIEPQLADVKLEASPELAQLVRQHRQALDVAKRAKEEADQIGDQVAALVGNNTLITFKGRSILTYRPVNRFAGAKFTREQPELAQFYMFPVTKEELDVDLIRRTKPDLYQQYQVRSMINGWDE